MRSLIVLTVGATLLLLVSCTDNLKETIIPHMGDVIELTAYADNGATTKTGIVDNASGGKNVVWKSGNAISLFFNSGDNGGNKFTTTDSGPVATFKGSISAISGSLEETGGKAYFWGLYPYNASASCDGTYITTTLPSSQLAYEGDVADDLLVTVGRSENLAMSFKNACAVIGFTLSQDNISKIYFGGINNETVAGKFKASFGSGNQLSVTPIYGSGEMGIKIIPAESTTFTKGKTYYFAILPGTFSSGYRLTFITADGTVATYERTSSFTFAISTFYTMTNKDSGLSFNRTSPELDQIWYTSSDGKMVTPPSLYGFGADYMSHTYSNGKGVITFSNYVTSFPTYAFYGCSSLTSIEIPETVKSIGEGAFRDCIGLTSVKIPTLLESIGNYAFSNCESLTAIKIPYRLGSIGDWVFSNCTGLTSIEIPDSVTYIGDSAFSNCTGLTSVDIPSSVKYILDDAFFGCSNLKKVNITDLEAWCKIVFSEYNSPFTTPYRLFLNGAEVTTLEIPNSITNIGFYAFDCCTSLISVVIPESVTSIGNFAFASCSNLTSITICNETPPQIIVNEYGDNDYYPINSRTTIYVPKNSVDAYKTADGWKRYASKIQAITE